MKIALIPPQILKTPPEFYGGAEKVVADLGECLVNLGHDVTLFAPPGSHIPGATLVETVLAPETVQCDWLKTELEAFETYKNKLQGFDIIHSHDWFGAPYMAKIDPANKDLKICHTHHGALSWDVMKVPEQIKPINLIAISKHMQSDYKKLGWESKVSYNGINLDSYPLNTGEREDYLVCIARITKEKGIHIALKAALETGQKLKIMGGSFVNDKIYLEAIKKECEASDGLCSLALDVDHKTKLEVLSKAKASLIPSQFREPFNLVAPESLSCGTPVICLADGALPEIINTLLVGRVCNDYDSFLRAVKEIDTVKYDPLECRKRAEVFSRENMARNYLTLYEEIIAGKSW